MACPVAYCDDHLPDGHCIQEGNPRFEALGFFTPTQAVYIFCSGKLGVDTLDLILLVVMAGGMH